MILHTLREMQFAMILKLVLFGAKKCIEHECNFLAIFEKDIRKKNPRIRISESLD